MVEERRRFYADQYSKLDPPRQKGVPSEGGKWWAAYFEHRASKGLTPVDNLFSAHIRPIIRDKHPRDWTPADCEAVRDSLDAKIAAGSWECTLPSGETRRYRFGWKRAWNVWALWTSACKAASRSKNKALRARTDNPCADIEPPDRGHTKKKQWLFPFEFVQLMACGEVPRRWRVLYALLTYSYLRPNELAALISDRDVALDTNLFSVNKAWDFKKGEPKPYPKTSAGVRYVPIEPELRPLVEALLEGCNPGDLLLPNLPPPEDWAETLRRHLRRAGVDRAELFEDTPTMKQITLYDLRATGITWRTLRGDDARIIQRAAGHERYSTTEGYVREAELFRGRVGDPFPPLPPEFRSPKRSPNTQVREIIASPRGFETLLTRASAGEITSVLGDLRLRLTLVA